MDWTDLSDPSVATHVLHDLYDPCDPWIRFIGAYDGRWTIAD